MITGLLMTLSLAGALYTVRVSMETCAYYQLGGRNELIRAKYGAKILSSTAVTIGAAFLGGYLL